jgi:hypothetical protein
MIYKKIYKITLEADDEKQLPTEDKIRLMLDEIPADIQRHIDIEDVRACENCMCAIVEKDRIYCNFFHFNTNRQGCTWWRREKK